MALQAYSVQTATLCYKKTSPQIFLEYDLKTSQLKKYILEKEFIVYHRFNQVV